MKNARIFSVLMAVVMLVVAVLPTPAAAMQSTPPSSASTFGSSAFGPLSMTNFYIPDN